MRPDKPQPLPYQTKDSGVRHPQSSASPQPQVSAGNLIQVLTPLPTAKHLSSSITVFPKQDPAEKRERRNPTGDRDTEALGADM